MKLAIIPARGGSMRIPRKNIKLFAGKPIIGWSIETARRSGLFDRVIVSTDDEEIASVAIEFGAEVPFIRPAELSDDYTNTSRVIAHAIEWYLNLALEPTQICCIYPTTPFLQSNYIEQGITILKESGADFVFSATTFTHPIQRAFKLRPDGRVEMFDPSKFQTRSQDLPRAYHDAGQFYWGTRAAWLSGHPIFGPNSIPIVLPRHYAQDIDTNEDWAQAELMMKVLKSS